MVYLILSTYSLILASFLHVVGSSYPVRRPFLLRKSSECDHCGKKLRAIDMIPVMSFVMLKGRSNCCNERMSRTYFIVELLSPIFICTLYSVYGFNYSFYVHVFIFSLLIILYVSDIFYLHIPNLILLVYFLGFAGFYGLTNRDMLSGQLYQLFMGCIIFLGTYFLVRRGFGFGDIKLLILLCFLLSLKEALFIFVIAVFSGVTLIGAAYMFQKGLKAKKIPFVPFILVGFMCSPFISDYFWKFIFHR
ncbi:A24 family peptidase [Listeria grandensis]|uniref:prepilin peptidase n=1 Tax=Listeria grandensis TaxID=1494963 RepID=UPI00164E1CC4|nr:prepilin peptidase [Listeria grandensis]